MNSKIFYSSDLNNKDDQVGLFDRIINIKFTRKNGKSFTLRSDYEAVWDGRTLAFKTCQPKPEIRVQYTQYNAVMINIDIYVTNLNIFEEPDQTALDQAMINAGIDMALSKQVGGKSTNQPNDTLTMLGNPVTKAEIELGYRGNFYNWGTHKVKNPQADYEAFQNLTLPGTNNAREQLLSSQEFFMRHRRCNVVIEWAANISNPPDRITQFHGYIGATEAGFQPFSLLAIDCASEAGAAGVITKRDIVAGLDDEYYKIDEVSIEAAKKEAGTKTDPKDGTPFDLVAKAGLSSSFRNFFNGGRAFTLLEGYCFHMTTRRFVRSNIDVKRNSNLERAALEYALASSYTDSTLTLGTLKKQFTQNVYQREQEFYKDYFIKNDEGDIVLTDKVDTVYKEYLEAQITTALVAQYVGVRFTIKNLPEYRKLYIAIRKKLTTAAQKGEYLSWWDAASELGSQDLAIPSELNITDQQQNGIKSRKIKEIEDKIFPVRQYTLALEDGENAFADCYFKREFIGDDWILPVQNIKSSVDLKDSKKNIITFKKPTKAIEADPGFNTLSGNNNAKCFTGLFEVRDAYMFGVPVLCSRKASESFQSRTLKNDTVALRFFSSPQTQIEWICATWDLKYYKLHNGGYYIYAEHETARDVSSQDFVKSQSRRPFKIPAIYDIAITPIRKIRMPFMAFLDPMTVVEWNSSSMIGSMISFYYQPDKGRNFFMIVKNSIDFCTTGDYNTMELEMVDTQWTDKAEVPSKVTVNDKKETYVETIIFPDDQMDSWRKVYDSPACTIPFNMQPDWPVTVDVETSKNGNKISNKQFFTMFQIWNKTLFDMAKEGSDGWSVVNWFSRVDKQANRLYGKARPVKTNFPDIFNCLEEIADTKLKRIYMRFPVLAEGKSYANMKEYDANYVMVYQKGLWFMALKTEYNDKTIGEG